MAKQVKAESVPAPEEEKRPERGGSANFGEEGSNKTLPTPDADAQPSDELQGTRTKYIPRTPYTRG